MSVINPTCPTDCSSLVPDVDFDACAPKVLFGEIHKIYLASSDATPFTDVESLAEWTVRIVETGGDAATAIRELTVSADQPAPDMSEIEISNKRKVYPPKKWTLSVDIDDLTDTNYEFVRATGCNTQFRMWYQTDDHIYGGTDGILCSVVLNPSIERGNQSIQKATGTITWEALYAPERNDSPFAV